MIREEYVNFETAKLLKEAGFPQWVMTPTGERDGVPCVKCYRKDGLLTDWIFMRGHKSAFSAPTQAQAMRWLREEKEISVESGVTMLGDWVSNVWLFSLPYYPIHSNLKLRYQTYEAAAEAGIQAACKYIIEKNNKQNK